MKKNHAIQLLRLMRYAILLILLFFPSLRGNGMQLPQNKLNVKSGTVASVFDQIRMQTHMEFFYNTEVIDVNRTISKDMMDMSLAEILREVLGDDLSYSIRDNYILISEKKRETTVQQQTFVDIRGMVKNERGRPLAKATVKVVGTNMLTLTDDDGKFLLKGVLAKEKIELQASYVGKQTVIITYTGQEVSITLKEAKSEIDTVVVTGFFKRPTEGFSGAYSTLTRDELQRVSTGNIFTTMNLLDPSFMIIPNNDQGSNPNNIPDFVIRGKGSFQEGSTKPLFILDGLEVSVETVFDLDVERIETITILKDASAAILYGSRAANGVVVIETILPKAGKLSVSYSFKPTIEFPDLRGYDLMNATEKLEYERLAGLYDESYSLTETLKRQAAYYERLKNVIEGVDTYWLSQPLRTSFSQAHSVAISGGADQITYSLDGSYNDTQGVMKKSSRIRTALGFTLGYRIRNSIQIQNRVSYYHTKSTDSPYGTFSTYAQLNPYERAYDDNGKLLPQLFGDYTNPLYEASLPSRDITTSQTMSDQMYVEWTVFKNFRLSGQLGAVISRGYSENYVSPYSADYIFKSTYSSSVGQMEFVSPENRGLLSISYGESKSFSGSLAVSYNVVLNTKHLIYVGAGSEFQMGSSEGNGFSLTGFSDDRFSSASYAMQYKEGSKARSTEATTRAMGVFSTLNYMFDNRFFVDFSFRMDGSSTFGADKKYALFWSIGGGWNVHNEKFWKENSIIDNLKIRGSFGVTGNQNFSAYQAKTTYELKYDRRYWGMMPAIIMTYGNPNLKWQNSYSSNFGLDFDLVERRLSFGFNYYRRRTTNTVTAISVAPSIGIPSSSYTSNLGEILNVGYDFNFNAVIIRNRSNRFEWAMLFSGTNNKNKVLKLSNEYKSLNQANQAASRTPNLTYEEGQSMSAIKAVPSLGIDPVTGYEIFVKKDGSITNTWNSSDKVVVGVAEPAMMGSIATNISWRNWNLNLACSYIFNNDYYNQTLATRVEGASPGSNADRRVLNNRWKQPGDYALYRNIRDASESGNLSTRFLQREDMIQLKNVSLSYEVERKFLKRIGIKQLGLTGYINDLFRFSTIKEERGLSYPFSRSIVLGLRLSF